MGVVRVATASLVAALVVVLAPTTADAAPTAEVTPSTGLVELQQVTVSGSGFGASAVIFMCQAVDPGHNTTVARVLSLPTGAIDCSFADPACVIAAGEIVDFPRTVATAPLDVVGPGRPDVVIRQFGGTALTGDNVYNSTGAGQKRRRLVAPGGECRSLSVSGTMATRTRSC